MYSAHKFLSTILLAAAVSFAGCKSNSRSEQADALLAEASEAVAGKDYDKAFARLDTLDKAYRDCLDQRRRGTRLRTEVLRDLTLDSIAINDARLSELQRTVDALEGQFSRVDISGTRGFYVHDKAKALWKDNKTSVQPRIDDEGYFFIVADHEGRPIGLEGIEACGEKAHSGQHFTVENSEMLTVSQFFLTDLMEALVKANAPQKLTLLGSKGQASVVLDANALDAYRATWQYALARQELRKNLIRRERLERQLSRLRDTLANLPSAEETDAEN